jgi:hypothetical protein
VISVPFKRENNDSGFMEVASVESCENSLKPLGLSVDDLQGISSLWKRDWEDKSLVILLLFAFERYFCRKRKIRNKSEDTKFCFLNTNSI